MTARDEFLAAAGLREELFELVHNKAVLRGLVKIHPARRYREIMQELTFAALAEQFIDIEMRQPLFKGDELEKLLPDVVLEKLCNIFVKANTGRDPEKIKASQGERGAPQETPPQDLHGCNLRNLSGLGILTRLKIAAHIVCCPNGRTI